ncbi:MAG: glycoside hydrolase family 2 protein, partial [Verrucomicrobia bacterium]|nr:glycoside hydrolase family 2 protein [Verrucomicrobiota bacterium]
ASLAAQPRTVRDLDAGWKFSLGDHPAAVAPDFDDRAWRTLDVPHDWSIEGEISEKVPFGANIGYLPAGVGWYRRSFELTKADLARTIWVEFDGVYMNSEVWLNGHSLGRYPSGYNSFFHELERHAREGTNWLAVRVDNSQQPNSRWYAGSGIYRHVRLVLAGDLWLEQYGTVITTPQVTEDTAGIVVRAKVANRQARPRSGELRCVILDPAHTEVGRWETSFRVDAAGSAEPRLALTVPRPARWSPDTPELYTVKVQVWAEGAATDERSIVFGIRRLEFDPQRGFLLNGTMVKMKGVNLHHDGGCVGAAVPEAVWERRLRILKAMGCNAIRTAHNPVAPEFLELCDRLGFLVLAESFDEWQEPRSALGNKITYGYHSRFDEWAERDLVRMVRRDRNHPSIVMWSVGNEVGDQVTPRGHETLIRLRDICHREDPTRPVTVGCNRIANLGQPSTTPEFLAALDIVGYNYVDKWGPRRELYFTIDKLAHPERKMIGTENSSVYGFRGEYSLGDDPKVPAADYNTLMIDPGELWKYTLRHDFVMGDFMWTGYDYLGEARWPYLYPPCGVIDRCGFPKDAFYFYQALWTEAPVLHAFPHWNWPGREGQIIPVLCYTNCDAVELFVNGRSWGEKRRSFPRKGQTIVGHWSKRDQRTRVTTADLHLSWDVPYVPGTLTFVGRRGGR